MTMKRIYVILLFSAVIVNLYATSVSGHTILQRAFEQSAKSNLKVQMRNPLPPRPKELMILPYANKLIFYRKIIEKDVCLRVETVRTTRYSNEVLEVFIKNSEGIWGMAPDGFSAEVIEVPLVWLIELMFTPLTETELAYASYAIPVIKKYNGRNCYKIVVKLPYTEEFLHKITKEPIADISKKKSLYLSERPFFYEFLIDCQRYIIVDRKHYNANGKTIFSVNFDHWESLSNSEKLFLTPSRIEGKFLVHDFFSSRILEKMLKDRKTRQWDDLHAKIEIFIDWFLENGSVFFLIIASIAIITVIIIKRRK